MCFCDHRVLKNKCDLFALPLQQLSTCFLSLLISIFAAHSQHAHANGLFNGVHFDEVKMLIFNK